MSADLRTKTFQEMVGTTILDRYRLDSLLGFGGMGAVFKGEQMAVHRNVAIKILPRLDPLTAARFHREAKTASKLSHPNTITVFDFGTTESGFLYLVMEYLEGRTLGDVIKEVGALHPLRAAHITNQICRSLSEAHGSGIVHRDIKPDNIFLIHRNDDPDYVKVLDFGIAKVMAGEDSEEDLTQQGRIVGTPRYMAPEQVLGLPVDHRADIYSLGCILYQMLTGHPPFDDSSTAMLMMKHAHEQPAEFMYRMAQEHAANMPVGLEAVVFKAMAKRPEARQQNIDMLRTEMELVTPGLAGLHPHTPPDMSRRAVSGIMQAIAASGQWPQVGPGGAMHPSMSQPALSYPGMSQPNHPVPSGQHAAMPSGPHAMMPSGAWQAQASAPVTPSPDDPSHPSHPSLSHPALVPQVPSSGENWSVTINQAPYQSNEPPQPPTPTNGLPQLPSDESHSGAAWPPPSNSNRFLIAGLLALLLLLMLGAAAAIGFYFASTPQSPSKPQTAQAPTPPLAVVKHLRLESSPKEAAVFLNHQEDGIGTTPMIYRVPEDLESFELTMKLDGHESITKRFKVQDFPSNGEATWTASLIPVPNTNDAPTSADAQDQNTPAADPPKEQAQPAADNDTTASKQRAGRRKAARTTRQKPRDDAAARNNDEPAADKGAGPSSAKDADNPKSPTATAKAAEPAPKDPGNDAPSAKTGEDKPRKPNIKLLDGGSSGKPRVPTLDGTGGAKPKVAPLQ